MQTNRVALTASVLGSINIMECDIGMRDPMTFDDRSDVDGETEGEQRQRPAQGKGHPEGNNRKANSPSQSIQAQAGGANYRSVIKINFPPNLC